MNSSSTPSVYGSPEPKWWSSTLGVLGPSGVPSGPDHRLGLDLDEPARVEQLGDDAGRRRARGAERLAVGAADRVDVARRS